MSVEIQDVTMQPAVQVVEFGSAKIVGELVNISGDKLKAIQGFELTWETTLHVKPGESLIKSDVFIVNRETDDESHWQIQLDPNHVDKKGFHCVSVYVVLLDNYQVGTVIPATFHVSIPTDRNDQCPVHFKNSGISKFSIEKPSYGFENFIECIKLGRFTHPNNTEKLKFQVILTLFREATEEEEGKVLAQGAFPRVTHVNHDVPLKPDAYLLFNKEFIPVEKQRLSFYTAFFNPYFITDRKKFNKETQNLMLFCESKPLLMKIIEFCHNGKLLLMPKRQLAKINILRFANVLDIVELRDLCRTAILEGLQLNTFVETIECAKDKLLEENTYSVIYEFIYKNILELEKREDYKQTYEKNKQFYEALMYICDNIVIPVLPVPDSASPSSNSESDGDCEEIVDAYFNS